ncbi:DNA cytosine methyltransferase [Ancylothrix sp. C2]|uniref:DNA cytosine methyltransferase n=1 Tax=Ancylothrix sp. D3o TaxID=2953691 RepID=UPI0021BA8D57|nr:DNA cytosine methyltransferase [Ancylothrix sp. D3o]MCT7952504.1 DNA cytosine methyltransferase [Ancylothrix sp. D3o]
MRVVDLFSGCGGLSLGFQNAGFEVVAAFENWTPAIKVYERNFTHPIYLANLVDWQNNIQEIEQFKPGVIIGGPPCQDFSSAGKRDESLGRSDLTICFAEIVAKIQPAFFVMENVERIQKSAKYAVAKEILRAAGYGLSEQVLDASFCGVPQKRKRFFCVGELGGDEAKITPYLLRNLAGRPLTVREYLGESLGVEYYYRHPRSYQRRGIFSIDEPSPTVRGVNRPIPKNYQFHPGDSSQDIEKIRPLTTIERSYIQTFPKGFIFEGSKTDLEQMIGNAVPVKLAEYVGRCLIEYIMESENLGVKKIVETMPVQLCLPLF